LPDSSLKCTIQSCSALLVSFRVGLTGHGCFQTAAGHVLNFQQRLLKAFHVDISQLGSVDVHKHHSLLATCSHALNRQALKRLFRWNGGGVDKFVAIGQFHVTETEVFGRGYPLVVRNRLRNWV